MSDPTPLSPRHERFVAEYLKDGNATQAYIRAGYGARGAQPCASRLLRDPRIAAALAASRQRISEALGVSVERVTQELARIAFASVADFVSTDAEGRLHLDLEKAQAAQRAGIVVLTFANHNKPDQGVTLKLGKLQALAALTRQLGAPAARPTAAAETAATSAEQRQLLRALELLERTEARAEHAERALAEAQAALAAADARPADVPCEPATPAVEPAPTPAPTPAIEPQARQPLADPPAAEPQPAVMAMPDCTPGLYPNATFVWLGGGDQERGPDPADARCPMEPDAFAKR